MYGRSAAITFMREPAETAACSRIPSAPRAATTQLLIIPNANRDRFDCGFTFEVHFIARSTPEFDHVHACLP
jgi:hypothetical protein